MSLKTTVSRQSLVSVCLGVFVVLVSHITQASGDALRLTDTETGRGLGDNLLIWHDPSGEAGPAQAVAAFQAGEFATLGSQGSTGLAPGAFWGRFRLENPTDQAIELRLEYIDHQLITLRAYRRDDNAALVELADLALDRPFAERPVPHHRFVIPDTVAANSTTEYYVRYGSHQMGFVFPDLRLWSPAALAKAQAWELFTINLIVGGLLVMTFISLVGGLATRERSFYIYCLHALASIAVWFTVFGFAHQFLLTESFHQKYMSIAGALSLFTGVYFAREFLKTRDNIPRFDYLLLFLMANSVFLLVAALAEQTQLAVISITLALLLYPCVSIAGFIRWRQGAREAGIFTVAWTFLVIGLVTQALRDLGVVEHNFVNYYWPAVASYSEMVVILIAMGIRIRDLRGMKEAAEQAHLEQLEHSKEQLEAQVAARTRELEAAKTAAEIEASTDTLTGVNNRRSFMSRGQKMLDRCKLEKLPLNLIMLDIDHFKSINDQHGHDVGDRALMAFADVVMSFVRDRDLFGRLGGEEFALMLISSPESAVQTAERLRAHVRSIELKLGSNLLNFSISIGVAHLGEEQRLEELLKQADRALYAAKQAGRDRVEVADSQPDTARLEDSARQVQ